MLAMEASHIFEELYRLRGQQPCLAVSGHRPELSLQAIRQRTRTISRSWN